MTSRKYVVFTIALAIIAASVFAMTYTTPNAIAEDKNVLDVPEPPVIGNNVDMESLVESRVKSNLAKKIGIQESFSAGEVIPPKFRGELEASINVQSFIPTAHATHTQTHYGTLFDTSTSNINGVYAKNEVHDTGVSLNDAEFLYAPTSLSANKSPIEIVIFYQGTSSGTTKKVHIYDHTLPHTQSWQTSSAVDIDNNFMNTYTVTSGVNDYYFAAVTKNGNTWDAQIYNYDTSSWDTLYSQTDETARSHGWTYWEEWHLGTNCPTLPQIDAELIQVRDNGVWKAASSSYASVFNSNPSCTYAGTHNSNYDDWQVDD